MPQQWNSLALTLWLKNSHDNLWYVYLFDMLEMNGLIINQWEHNVNTLHKIKIWNTSFKWFITTCYMLLFIINHNALPKKEIKKSVKKCGQRTQHKIFEFLGVSNCMTWNLGSPSSPNRPRQLTCEPWGLNPPFHS